MKQAWGKEISNAFTLVSCFQDCGLWFFFLDDHLIARIARWVWCLWFFLFKLFCSELILLKRILMPKEEISCSECKSSGGCCCVPTGFQELRGRCVFRIGWIFYNSTSLLSIQYLQWSRIKAWLQTFHWGEFCIAGLEIKESRVCLFALCSFVHCAQKRGRDKPFDICIFSVCIWLHIKQALQQTRGEDYPY